MGKYVNEIDFNILHAKKYIILLEGSFVFLSGKFLKYNLFTGKENCVLDVQVKVSCFI